MQESTKGPKKLLFSNFLASHCNLLFAQLTMGKWLSCWTLCVRKDEGNAADEREGCRRRGRGRSKCGRRRREVEDKPRVAVARGDGCGRIRRQQSLREEQSPIKKRTDCEQNWSIPLKITTFLRP